MPSFTEHLPQLANAALVILLSGLIGFEREARRRPAGLKTHIVVGLSAWLLVEIGLTVTHRYVGADSVAPDPIRIVQAIVYGISFIGAGTIFSAGGREAARIVGLTTAASLLATTSIAIAVGFGERFIACAVTAMILLVLVVIGALERRLVAAKRD
jgi:putative Mg2+ transporter-C (MgtC) family protein